MRLYRVESSDAKTNAQRNLIGRTHYVDEDTLRFHKSRVLSARVIAGGLLFYIVESCALDPENRKRGFRAVLFDVYGTVLTRDKLEETSRTHDAAVKKLHAFLSTFDAKTYTLAEIDKQRTRYLFDASDFAGKVEKLDATIEKE